MVPLDAPFQALCMVRELTALPEFTTQCGY